MQEEGYISIMNIDNSQIVIDDMKSFYQDKEGIEFACKDVMSMDFPSSSFDAVIDKGTLDSILCGDRSNIMARRMLTQVQRVLKPQGIFVSISYAPPENRNRYLKMPDFTWNVFEYRISKPVLSTTAAMTKEDGQSIHYVYVCVKKRVDSDE
mmetsp:Transcript_12516/g.12585  ORF Transcript_12516/g.12585 Transcript_12516/m.12585 type:complete len:152 (+) Transcript_12516:160-615(+)